MNPEESQHPEIPSAPASEAAYLAAMLAGRITTPFLDPDEFRQERHAAIYQRAARRLMNDEPFAASLLVEELSDAGELGICGGAGYLELLATQGQTVSLEVADEHARLIRAKSTAFKLQQLAALALDDAASNIEGALSSLLAQAEILQGRMRLGTAPRYSTDADLDAILGKISWLWDKWILNGFVTGVVAQQETGKSSVMLDLCGRLLTGKAWPDGSATNIDPNCKLLWIDTEMAIAALAQRLDDWGLPRGRFILPEDPTKLLQLDNAADWNWIEGVMAQFRPPLVVIDALSGAHRGEEKDNDSMKVILQRLSQLAQSHRCAVVVIHHIRKASVGEADYPIVLDRVRGASAITQFCRSVIALGTPDKSQPESRRVDSIKSNFARKPESLGYWIGDEGVFWGAAPEVPKSANPIEGARAFLLDYLGQGARLSEETLDAGIAEGLAKRTIERAKIELNVKSFREKGSTTRWFWALPGKGNIFDLNSEVTE